jgi:hypothetical protein
MIHEGNDPADYLGSSHKKDNEREEINGSPLNQ